MLNEPLPRNKPLSLLAPVRIMRLGRGICTSKSWDLQMYLMSKSWFVPLTFAAAIRHSSLDRRKL